MKNRLLKVAKYLSSHGMYEEAAQIKKIAVEDEPEWGDGSGRTGPRNITLGSLVVGHLLRQMSEDSGMADLPISRGVENILNNLMSEFTRARVAQQKKQPTRDWADRVRPDEEFAEMIHQAFQEITARRGDWRSAGGDAFGWGWPIVQRVTQLADAVVTPS